MSNLEDHYYRHLQTPEINTKYEISDYLVGNDGSKMQMLISRLPQLFARKAQSNAAAVRR